MSKLIDNVIVRLTAYYAAALGLHVFLMAEFPALRDAIIRERSRGIVGAFSDFSKDELRNVEAIAVTDTESLALITLTLVGSLIIALPVALVYQWTTTPESYRRDFARALIALPIGVALAVFLVKNNLALAFCLGGIAAVIRWRAALRETMDGVFMFVMIGIGLAAGVQLLLVAVVASVTFNALILTLNRTSYAAQPRSMSGWMLATPVEAAGSEGKRNVRVRIDAPDEAQAEAKLAAILPLCAKEWRKTSATPLAGGSVRLEYVVRLKKSTTADSLVSTIADLGVPAIGEVVLTRDA